MSLIVNVLSPNGRGTNVGVPAMTVELVGKASAKTDKRGQAVFASVKPGVYDLKVRDEEGKTFGPWYDVQAPEYWHTKHVEAMKKAGRTVDEDLVADGVNGLKVRAGMNTVDVWIFDRTVTLPSAAAAANAMSKIQQSRALLLRGLDLAERVYELAGMARASRTFMEEKRSAVAGAAGSLNSVAGMAEILKREDPVHKTYYAGVEAGCRQLAEKLYKVIGGTGFYELLLSDYRGGDANVAFLSKRMKEWSAHLMSLAVLLLDKDNQTVIREVFASPEIYPVHAPTSRLVPYYWEQAGKPPSRPALDPRLLLDAALALALREFLNAPFAAKSVDALFGGPGGGADAPAGGWLKSFEAFLGQAANGVGPATAIIGNLPGPPSLWVVVAQHRALQMVKQAALGVAPGERVGQLLHDLNERYRPLGKHLAPDALEEIRKGLTANHGKEVRAAQQKLYDWVGDTVHTQPRMHGLMTVFQLVLAALAYSKVQSVGAETQALEYVSLVIPLVNAGMGTVTGAVTTAAALTTQQSGRVASLMRSALPRLGLAASVGAIGSFVVSIVAVSQLPPHASAFDRVFAWIDLASTGMGASGVLVAGFVSGVLAAKFFAAGAILGGVGVGVKLAFEAGYTGVTRVILARIDNVARDPVLAYVVSDLPRDCKALLDLDTANRIYFGKSFRPDKHDLQRLKDELLFGENEIKDMVVP